MINLILLSSLAGAVALPNPVNLANSPVDVNDPSASDPTEPTTPISFPLAGLNPLPLGIPDMPDGCDGQDPSSDCFDAMTSKNNYIWFDNDSGCTDEEKSQIATAVWDATTLANYASTFPNTSQNRGQASGVFWMGPDWASLQSRIAGNLGRAGTWKPSNNGEYITVSCTDSKKQCSRNEGIGAAVGGYAWTYDGWFGYHYHYITLCKPFFSLDTLNKKITDVENELASGNTQYATNMLWLRTSGQYFLHEMMHLQVVNGPEPHIGDQVLTGDWAAYGPKRVHALATESIYNGGGAEASTINADSYALLANSMWWWDTTGYFPGLPAKTTDDDDDVDDFPVSFFIDLGDAISPTIADWDSLYAPQVQYLQNVNSDVDIPPTTTIYVTPVPAPTA